MTTHSPKSDNSDDEPRLEVESGDDGVPYGYGTIEVAGYASAEAPHVGILHEDEPTSVHVACQSGDVHLDVDTEDDDGVRVGARAHLDADQAEEVAYNLLAAAEDLREAQDDE